MIFTWCVLGWLNLLNWLLCSMYYNWHHLTMSCHSQFYWWTQDMSSQSDNTVVAKLSVYHFGVFSIHEGRLVKLPCWSFQVCKLRLPTQLSSNYKEVSGFAQRYLSVQSATFVKHWSGQLSSIAVSPGLRISLTYRVSTSSTISAFIASRKFDYAMTSPIMSCISAANLILSIECYHVKVPLIWTYAVVHWIRSDQRYRYSCLALHNAW